MNQIHRSTLAVCFPLQAFRPECPELLIALLINIVDAKYSVSVVRSEDISFGTTILTAIGSHHAVFHHIPERMQLASVVGNAVIVAQSPHFTVKLVENAQVIPCNERFSVNRMPDFYAVLHANLHCAKVEQLLLYQFCGNFQLDMPTIVSGIAAPCGFSGQIGVGGCPDIVAQKSCSVGGFGD